ncbi:NPCBM/NEW2 domain-containing protein [Streptomyces sp. NPDC058770]|uniref:NPCBM/NEW2 domain-containing protein n=1 Tax=unclassified Streptomyces TaxID=2593676 RepID=UPI0036C8ED2F
MAGKSNRPHRPTTVRRRVAHEVRPRSTRPPRPEAPAAVPVRRRRQAVPVHGARGGPAEARAAVGASAPADADPGPDASPDDSGGANDEGDGPSTPGVADSATEVSLTTPNPVADADGFEVGSANLNTRLRTDAHVASPDCTTEPYMEFDLGRAWTTFDLTAGIDDDSHYETGRLTVKVDDTTLWVGTLEPGKPQRLSLKVANGLRLRIQVDEDCDGAKLTLGTPLLKR